MTATFSLVADAQGTNAHQVLFDSHITKQLLASFRVKHLAFPVNPAGAEPDFMCRQHHGMEDDAAVVYFIAVGLF